MNCILSLKIWNAIKWSSLKMVEEVGLDLIFFKQKDLNSMHQVITRPDPRPSRELEHGALACRLCSQSRAGGDSGDVPAGNCNLLCPSSVWSIRSSDFRSRRWHFKNTEWIGEFWGKLAWETCTSALPFFCRSRSVCVCRGWVSTTQLDRDEAKGQLSEQTLLKQRAEVNPPAPGGQCTVHQRSSIWPWEFSYRPVRQWVDATFWRTIRQKSIFILKHEDYEDSMPCRGGSVVWSIFPHTKNAVG